MQELFRRSLKLFHSLNRLKIFDPLLYRCFDVTYYMTKPCCLSFAGKFFLSHCCHANSTRKKWVSHKGMVNQMCVITCINMFSKEYSVALIDLELLENQPRNEHFSRAVDRNYYGCLTSYLRNYYGPYLTSYQLITQTTNYVYRQLLLVEEYVLAFLGKWTVPIYNERNNSKRKPERVANDIQKNSQDLIISQRPVISMDKWEKEKTMSLTKANN